MTRAAKRRYSPIQIVIAVSMISLLAVVPIALFAQRQAAIAKADALEVNGPACQVLSPQQYAGLDLPATQVTNVERVIFARRDGNIDCEFVATHHGRGLDTTPVCRFNNPTVLAVSTRRGRYYFYTGISPATVNLENDRPSCVLAVSNDN